MNPQHFQNILKQVSKLDPVQKQTLTTTLAAHENPILTRLSKEVITHSKCIHCQSNRLRKYGFSNGRQRFFCNECRKSFVCTRGSAYFYQHKPELWQKYLEHMLDQDSIRRCAKDLNICVTTSFNWRHRFMNATQNTYESRLEGIIEADETYFRESKKGERNLNRPARQRGSKASTPGINQHDWVTVLTAKDRNHHEFDQILTHVNGAEINQCLGCKIADESILCTDGQPAYNQICKEHHLHHVVIANNQTQQSLYHIQNINNYHSQLKCWYLKMHGVASKYLAKYLGWFRMLDWHKYQTFSSDIKSESEKLFEFKLLQVQQHKFET
ncbi:IS1595 family transposase [Marinicellulosiphila megalodicopiae]|uniref:IS1595 family transposase n=1 Tax=Marinicellulosiphila megalodicopiae TaxID=2724896 RepID=UPI003BB08E02